MEDANITTYFSQSINSIFSNLISSIDTAIYENLDDLIFINADIVTESSILNILGDGTSSGIILICNSLLYAFLIYYGFSLLFSYLTFSQVQRPSQFIFKLLLCVIALNSTRLICYGLIYITSHISLAIRNIGETLFSSPICFSSLIQNLNSTITLQEEGFNLFTFYGLIKALVSVRIY